MNIDRIFDAAMGVSEVANLADMALREQQQITDINSETCGNCDLWMKSGCEREKKFNEFKSINSYACKDFTLCYSSKKLTVKFASFFDRLLNGKNKK